MPDLALAEWIKSPGSGAAVWGPPEWEYQSGVWSGTWSGSCQAKSLDDELDVHLVLRERVMKCTEPTVLLQAAGITWHIDHNSAHRDQRTGRVEHTTHLQLSGHSEICHYLDPRKLCSPPMDSASLSEDDLRRLLIASAREMNVGVHGLDWMYHEEGGQ